MDDMQKTVKKYTGKEAKNYHQKIAKSLKWKAEKRILEEYLQDLSKGISVLDIPFGTGSLSLPNENTAGITGIEYSRKSRNSAL